MTCSTQSGLIPSQSPLPLPMPKLATSLCPSGHRRAKRGPHRPSPRNVLKLLRLTSIIRFKRTPNDLLSTSKHNTCQETVWLFLAPERPSVPAPHARNWSDPLIP
jgi:hypothetical protein